MIFAQLLHSLSYWHDKIVLARSIMLLVFVIVCHTVLIGFAHRVIPKFAKLLFLYEGRLLNLQNEITP
jgi:ABC-type cobalamin transport system permease subunit